MKFFELCGKVCAIALASVAALLALAAYGLARASGARTPRVSVDRVTRALTLSYGRPEVQAKRREPEPLRSAIGDPKAKGLAKAESKSALVTPMRPPVQPNGDEKKLIGALAGLGFNARDVKASAEAMRDRYGREPLPELLKEAIQKLSA